MKRKPDPALIAAFRALEIQHALRTMLAHAEMQTAILIARVR